MRRFYPILRRRPSLKGLLLGLLTGVALAGLGLVGSNLYLVWRAGPYIAGSPASAPKARAAIVLGAAVYPGGRPSPVLADRLDVGIGLYREGKVQKLLLSGDRGSGPYNEVDPMRAYVLAQGVPPNDVFVDPGGFDTLDTMYRARELFMIREALVVTQGFHLARAVYTARALGLEATGVASDLRTYRDAGRYAAREWLARANALVELHLLHSRPRLPDEKLDITGDGRQSW
jgi:SanA protein